MKAEQVTVDGNDMVIMPKSEHDALVQKLDIIVEKRRIEKERENGIPHTYFHRVLDGENAIKVYREWRGLTQKQLADKIGTSQSYVGNMENGKRKGDIILYANLAKALEVSIDDIVPITD